MGYINGIASTAPYLGLVGACCGVMSALTGIGMERHAALAVMTSIMAAALLTTAAGIIVAVSATCSYNYLCTRLDLIQNEATIPKFPLEKRFSQPPAFARIAAPALAISITVFISVPSPQSPKGLDVRVLKIGSLEPERRPGVEPVLIRLLGTSAGLPTIACANAWLQQLALLVGMGNKGHRPVAGRWIVMGYGVGAIIYAKGELCESLAS